jgi:tetratricopeptide (TPR) repeat protein
MVIPLHRERNIIKAALEVEKNHPDLKGRLVAALQFRHYDLTRTNFSKALVDMTGRQALGMTSGINFNEIVSGYPLWTKLRSGAIVAGLAVIIGLLIPGIFSKAIEVYSQPTAVVAPPPGFSVVVSPGDAERVKYSDVAIGGALIGGGFADEAEIYYRFAEGRWQSERQSLLKREIYATEMGDSLPFVLTLKQVRRSFDYYIVAGEVRTETYSIDIVERPRVTSMKVTITSPSYTRLEPLTLDENTGSFAALVGSRAALEINANRDIDEAYLITDDSSRIRIDFAGQNGFADLSIAEDFSYHIRLFDREGEQNPDPIEYMVTAVPDEYPIIDVVYPGFDLNLDETMVIPFSLYISDDFGFSSLVLKYQVVSGGRKGTENIAVINFSEKIETEGEVSFNWNVEPFNLLPSDYVLYHFELADNDRVSGPKITGTRVYAARLPSIDEIVMQTETDQEGRVFEAEKILREQREAAEKLRQLAEQIRAADNVDWQQKKDLENLVDQQELTAEKLEEMARQMEESIKEMDNNNLLSEQILEKLMELQKLFHEVATPEMKEAMKKLAEALKNMDQQELEEAMKDFQMSQDEMLDRLQRSVELLKRMQVQQKMSAMLKMIEEALLEQNRVNVDTEESLDKESSSRLSAREQQLQKQMDALKKEAEKLEELLKEPPYNESDGHKRFAEAVKENQAKSDMGQMEQSLDKLEQDEALDHGQDASEKLGSMLSELQELMAKLASDEGDRLAKEIRKAIDDTNYLSEKQEEIHGACESNNFMVPSIGEAAAQQEILRESVEGLMERIRSLANESPFLAAEIRTFLEQSMEKMSGACQNLGNGSKRGALEPQRDAMFNLNRASIKLLDGLENQKQCNKGGSCNKPGMKMQSMCQKQSQINQETKGQCPNPGQQLSSGQRAALKRLAGEQGTVHKSLQEMQAEFGDRREILGRLDALAEEAKAIEEMLEEGQVGGDLQDRQLRIYSRMLDVQKSINRRDYSRERRAVTAEDIFRMSPGPLDDDGSLKTETLQDRLNRYLREGYPRQYEQQIKAYFKAISNMGQNRDEN